MCEQVAKLGPEAMDSPGPALQVLIAVLKVACMRDEGGMVALACLDSLTRLCQAEDTGPRPPVVGAGGGDVGADGGPPTKKTKVLEIPIVW